MIYKSSPVGIIITYSPNTPFAGIFNQIPIIYVGQISLHYLIQLFEIYDHDSHAGGADPRSPPFSAAGAAGAAAPGGGARSSGGMKSSFAPFDSASFLASAAFSSFSLPSYFSIKAFFFSDSLT